MIFALLYCYSTLPNLGCLIAILMNKHDLETYVCVCDYLESPDVLVPTMKTKETLVENEKEVRSQQKQKRLPPADFKVQIIVTLSLDSYLN